MDSYAEASVAVAGDMSLSVSVPDSDSDSEWASSIHLLAFLGSIIINRSAISTKMSAIASPKTAW